DPVRLPVVVLARSGDEGALRSAAGELRGMVRPGSVAGERDRRAGHPRAHHDERRDEGRDPGVATLATAAVEEAVECALLRRTPGCTRRRTANPARRRLLRNRLRAVRYR